MATATLGNTPTVIDNAEATTNWNGDTFSLEPDIKVQGNNSVACAMTPAANGSQEIYVAGTWDFSGTGLNDQHLRLWANISFGGNLQTEANNGWQIFISDGTNTSYWTISGSDAYAGGWQQFVIYTGDAPTEDSGTPANKASLTRIGMRVKVLTKPRNVPANSWFDAWTFGDGFYATGGTGVGASAITLSDIAAVDLINAYNIVTDKDGVISIRGAVQIGNGSTTTYFDADSELIAFPEEAVNVGLYSLVGDGAGCRIAIADSAIKAAGVAAKDAFDFDMDEANLLSMSLTGTFLIGGDEVIFKSGQTGTGNIINGCGQVTHAGVTMNNTIVKAYEGTVDTSALIYNNVADPNGEMDGMSFTKGSAATHAIEFGLSSPTSITLTGIDFSGYNANDDQTDSTFHVKRTSGTVTINIVGGSGNVSYKSDGADVSVVQNPVALTITCKDSELKTAIEGVAVTVSAASGGPFPFEVSVTISRIGTVATVAHTAHPYVVGNKVEIKDAVENEYNRIKTIIATLANSYDFTVEGSPDTPATGTITSTTVLIDGRTNASGVISDTRTYSSDQPISGTAKKGTHAPVYVPSPIDETIDKDIGLSITTLMNPDD